MPPAFFLSHGIDKAGWSVILQIFNDQKGADYATIQIKTFWVRYYLIAGSGHAVLQWRLTGLSHKVLCASADFFYLAVMKKLSQS